MSTFSFRKLKNPARKKPRLHKRPPLATQPAGYRVPFSDEHSPLRIIFVDDDEHRAGMKFAQLLSEDGSVRPLIIKEEVWLGLTGDATQDVVDEALIAFPEFSPGEIRQQIQAALESHNKCKVILPHPQPEGRCTVEMIVTNWIEMLYVDLYVRTNKVRMWLDAEADLAISGYELFARGVLDKDCILHKDPMQPTPEQRGEYADLFDLIDCGNAKKEANKRAQRTLMFVYEHYLYEHADATPSAAELITFGPSLQHNLHAVHTWMAEQMMNSGIIRDGMNVARVDGRSGTSCR
jgi:hypothetical protein